MFDLIEDFLIKPVLGATIVGVALLGEAFEGGRQSAKLTAGKCRACPERGLYRHDLGFFADDWCYEQYKAALRPNNHPKKI